MKSLRTWRVYISYLLDSKWIAERKGRGERIYHVLVSIDERFGWTEIRNEKEILTTHPPLITHVINITMFKDEARVLAHPTPDARHSVTRR